MATCRLERLRGELPDLAFELERQGRRDAADVVMQLYARAGELALEAPALEASQIIPHEYHRHSIS